MPTLTYEIDGTTIEDIYGTNIVDDIGSDLPAIYGRQVLESKDAVIAMRKKDKLS